MAKADSQKTRGDLSWQSASTFGPNSKHTTWKPARMNLVIRGIDANLGPRNPDNFHESRTLAALRDALRPKLLSGELRVQGIKS